MNASKTLAHRLDEVLLSGKWIAHTNVQEQLMQTDFSEATKRCGVNNTIAQLAFHLLYYLEGLQRVIDGGPLDIKDRESFNMPAMVSASDWEALRKRYLNAASQFVRSVENMDDERLQADFVEARYGTWQRNLEGVIEHSYYHLGQMVLIRKWMGPATV